MNDIFDAVVVDGERVELEICYNIADVESDSHKFYSQFHPDLRTLDQAKREVVEQAKAWVSNVRADGWDIGAWDSTGNSY